MKVNHATLVVLALLDTEPMHGHQIRRVSELVNLSAWAEVSTGAIYNTLRRLAADGEIAALRSEQEGNRPPRTVYALTEAGQHQLRRLREIALSQPSLDPAINIAIVFTAPGSDPDELRELLAERQSRLRLQHEDLVHHRERDTRLANIPVTARLSFRQWELRLAAEIAWHDELAAQIDELCDPAATMRPPDHTRPVTRAGRRPRADAGPPPAADGIPSTREPDGAGDERSGLAEDQVADAGTADDSAVRSGDADDAGASVGDPQGRPDDRGPGSSAIDGRVEPR